MSKTPQKTGQEVHEVVAAQQLLQEAHKNCHEEDRETGLLHTQAWLDPSSKYHLDIHAFHH